MHIWEVERALRLRRDRHAGHHPASSRLPHPAPLPAILVARLTAAAACAASAAPGRTMADISPFRGIRYRDDIVLDDVVAPPYDVLSAAQAAELRARSPYNAVHVDLPVPPGAAADEEAYLRAAATFRAWRDEGVAGARRAARHRRRRPDVHGAGRPRAHPQGLRRAAPRSPPWTSAWSCRTSARTPAPRSTACACTAPRTPTSARSSCSSPTTTGRRRAAGGRRHGAPGGRLARGARRRRQPAPLPPPSPARRPSASPRRCATARSTSPTATTATRPRSPTATSGGRRATPAPTRSWSTCAA